MQGAVHFGAIGFQRNIAWRYSTNAIQVSAIFTAIDSSSSMNHWAKVGMLGLFVSAQVDFTLECLVT